MFKRMTVAYSDSLPTLYVVHGRAKPVFRGPNSTEPNCSIVEKPLTGLDDCLNMLLPCFRERMSGGRDGKGIKECEGHQTHSLRLSHTFVYFLCAEKDFSIIFNVIGLKQ